MVCDVTLVCVELHRAGDKNGVARAGVIQSLDTRCVLDPEKLRTGCA